MYNSTQIFSLNFKFTCKNIGIILKTIKQQFLVSYKIFVQLI